MLNSLNLVPFGSDSIFAFWKCIPWFLQFIILGCPCQCDFLKNEQGAEVERRFRKALFQEEGFQW